MLDIKAQIKNIKSRLFGRSSLVGVFLPSPVQVSDPFKKITRQTVIFGLALLIVTSVVPTRILETGFTADFVDQDTDFVEEGEELPLPPFIMDEEGYVLKSAPASEEVSRIGLTDSVKHTVVSGDTLSGIASLYGISVKTLLWENGIEEGTSLKIGQTFVIPSVDGVSHVTTKNETLASLAKSYGVDVNLIKEHNNLDSDVIVKGQKLFIPGGKRKDPIITRAGSRSGGRAVAVNTFDSKVVMSSSAAPQEGKNLIFPTNGRITQGFRGRHYALDIGNASKPDIWASDSGTVVTASGGCVPRDVRIDRSCGHGYGNYVVVDHGGGLQTLYAHMETVYVSEGQQVDRGQALGKMGNSGRTYGTTGIHLHFEIFDNGVKKNPSNYF